MPASVATRENGPDAGDRLAREAEAAIKRRGHDAAHRLAEFEQRDKGQDQERARAGSENPAADRSRRGSPGSPACRRRAGDAIVASGAGSGANSVTTGPSSSRTRDAEQGGMPADEARKPR